MTARRLPLVRVRFWHGLLARTLRASTTDRMSPAAAGLRFLRDPGAVPGDQYADLPGWMVLDPVTAELQLAVLSGLLPSPAYSLIDDRVHQLIAQGTGDRSMHLPVSFPLTFWSSSTGARPVLSGLCFGSTSLPTPCCWERS